MNEPKLFPGNMDIFTTTEHGLENAREFSKAVGDLAAKHGMVHVALQADYLYVGDVEPVEIGMKRLSEEFGRVPYVTKIEPTAEFLVARDAVRTAQEMAKIAAGKGEPVAAEPPTEPPRESPAPTEQSGS